MSMDIGIAKDDDFSFGVSAFGDLTDYPTFWDRNTYRKEYTLPYESKKT